MKKANPFGDRSELEEVLGVSGDQIKERVRRGSARGGLLTSNDLFGEMITELADPKPPAGEPHTVEHVEAPLPRDAVAIDDEPVMQRPVDLPSVSEPRARRGDTAVDQPLAVPTTPGSHSDPYSLLDLAYSTLLQDPRLGGAEKPDTSPGGTVARAERKVEATTVGDYGQYVLLERIAMGGMAEVFRAKRKGVEGFEKILAIKRILPHLSSNKDFVEMFINEAKMVAGLSHPNIVTIFELGKIEDSYFIAMEYVDGRDLRAMLAQARDRRIGVSVDLSALIVSRVASALGHAHRQRDADGRELRIVHRDISPQNILISSEGEVKLVDFGIAKAAVKAPITDSGALRGKLLYMSPEQAWGKSIDHRSDIFSLGIVFFELLTGSCPFMSSSEVSILEMVRRANVPPPSTLNPVLPGQLEAVALKALQKSPGERYQDASEMVHDLETYLRGRPAVRSAELALFIAGLFAPDAEVTF